MDKKIYSTLCLKNEKKSIKTSPVFVSQANNEQVHEIMMLMAYTVKPVQNSHSKIDKTKYLNDKW